MPKPLLEFPETVKKTLNLLLRPEQNHKKCSEKNLLIKKFDKAKKGLRLKEFSSNNFKFDQYKCGP